MNWSRIMLISNLKIKQKFRENEFIKNFVSNLKMKQKIPRKRVIR